MTAGAHRILVGATELMHFCKTVPQERDYRMFSSLGEVIGALMKQSNVKNVICFLFLTSVPVRCAFVIVRNAGIRAFNNQV